jgi:hypothetical protein
MDGARRLGIVRRYFPRYFLYSANAAMRELAVRQATLEVTDATVEQNVRERTEELCQATEDANSASHKP